MAVLLVAIIGAVDHAGIDEHLLVVADGNGVGLAKHVPSLADGSVALHVAHVDTVALLGVAEQVGRVACGNERLGTPQVQGTRGLVDLDADVVETS